MEVGETLPESLIQHCFYLLHSNWPTNCYLDPRVMNPKNPLFDFTMKTEGSQDGGNKSNSTYAGAVNFDSLRTH